MSPSPDSPARHARDGEVEDRYDPVDDSTEGGSNCVDNGY